MSDYTPVFLPGQAWTSTAVGAISGGDDLEVAGSGTVQKVAASPSTKFVGVAGNDVSSGGRVTIYSAHVVHDGVAEGAITAGDQLTASAVVGKTVKTFTPTTVAAVTLPGTYDATVQTSINAAITSINTALTSSRGVVGVALTTAADGATVRWIAR